MRRRSAAAAMSAPFPTSGGINCHAPMFGRPTTVPTTMSDECRAQYSLITIVHKRPRASAVQIEIRRCEAGHQECEADFA